MRRKLDRESDYLQKNLLPQIIRYHDVFCAVLLSLKFLRLDL